MKDGPLCHKCPLNSAPGPVWGEGPPNAKLIIIGQCPGPEEIKAGRPFVGGSGRILDSALYRTGVQRPSCFVTNMVKCFVEPRTPVPQGAVSCCKPLLERELETVSSGKTVLTLGKEAFNGITGKEFKLDTDREKPNAWLRGSPWTIEEGARSFGGLLPLHPPSRYLTGRVVIPSAHPSFIAQTGFQLAPIFDIDIDRAARFAKGEAKIIEEFYNYSPSDAEVKDYVDLCILTGEFGLDIETPERIVDEEDAVGGQVTQIDVVGLSAREGESIGVLPHQFELLRPLFEGVPGHGRVRMYDFNDGFDGYHLSKRYTMNGVERFDCMLSLHHLFSQLKSKNLGVFLSLFTDIPFHKNLAKRCPELYNCRDTWGVLQGGRRSLAMMIQMLIHRPDLGHTGWENTRQLPQILTEMSVGGIRGDIDKAGRHIIALSKVLDYYEKSWNSVPMLANFSWTSPAQLKTLFTQVMKLPAQYNMVKDKKTGMKKKTLTCDEDALILWRDKHNSKVAGMVLEMRQIKHTIDVLNWFGPDGKMHPRFKAHGQVGHRIQAVDPAVQTISEEMYGINPREALIGDWDPIDKEDQWILAADFSQIEWRLYMYQANDEPGIKALESNIYVYGQLYEEIFKEPFFIEGAPPTKYNKRPDIPAWKLLVAKSGPLGWLYGRTDFSGLGISKAHSDHMGKRMDAEHPAVLEFHRKKLALVKEKGYAQTVFGRIRRFPGYAKPTDVFSFYGQTTAVDVLCANALLPLSRVLRDYRARLLYPVHDSVYISYPRRYTEELGALVKTTMESGIPQLNGLSIPAEVKVGPSAGKNELLEKYIAKLKREREESGTTRALSPSA